MSKQDKKQPYTGNNIPEYIEAIKGLGWTEKVLLSRIHNLSKKTGICSAKNAYLAHYMCMSPKGISNLINKLRKSGYIKFVAYNKNQRLMQIHPSVDVTLKFEHPSYDGTKFHQTVEHVPSDDGTKFHEMMPEVPSNDGIYNKEIATLNSKEDIKCDIKEIPALENLSLNSEKEKRKKKKSEAAKKEKEPQFGGGVPISLRLYECLLKKDANKFPSKPMQQHFKDLKSIIQTLKDFIKDEKKQRGEPYFNVTDNDILETWQVLLDNLSPRIIEKYFNTSSLARNLSSYLYEVKTGTHKTSGSGISQDFKDKLDNFLQENNI